MRVPKPRRQVGFGIGDCNLPDCVFREFSISYLEEMVMFRPLSLVGVLIGFHGGLLAFAETFYVSVGMAGTTQDGTFAHPYKYPQQAVNDPDFGPGDTVLVMGGTYKTSETLTNNAIVNQTVSGSSGSPITWVLLDNVVFLNDSSSSHMGFRFTNASYVIVNFNDSLISDMTRGGMELYDSHHITISGAQSSADFFNFDNCANATDYGGIHLQGASDYCTVEKIHLTGCGKGVKVGKKSSARMPQQATVTECYACGSTGGGSPGNGDGFQAGGTQCNNVTFNKCVAVGNSDDGFDVGQGADFVDLIGCVAAHNGTAGPGEGSGIKIGTYGDPGNASEYIELEDCVSFVNSEKGFDLFGSKDEENPIDPTVLTHCVASWNSGDQFYSEQGSAEIHGIYARLADGSIFWTVKTNVYGEIFEVEPSWLACTNGWKDIYGALHTSEGDVYDCNEEDDDPDNWTVETSRFGSSPSINDFAKVTGPVMPWDGLP